MSLEHEMTEISTLYHGQREIIQEQHRLLQEYYKMMKEYEEHFFFRASEKERAALQQRAKLLLERGTEHAR